ncbi:hypothetical protein IAU60_002877 [Kwoniella sp. DSM 27419]
MTTTPSSSRLPRPTPPRSGSSSSRYASPSSASSRPKSRNRSKSSSAHPKILPFPDLPLRAQVAAQASRESSRATSPLGTPPAERLDVTFDQLISMSRGGSSEGLGHGHRSSGSNTGTVTPVAHSSSGGISGSTSPPVSSPLAIGFTSVNRSRAFTAPSTTTAESVSAAASPPSTGRSAPSPVQPAVRSVGFPPSPSIPRPGMSLPNPPLTTTPATPGPPQQTPSSSRILPTATSFVLAATASPSNPSVVPPSAASQVKPVQRAQYTALTQPGPTTAITPAPSTEPLTDHLYQSFLKGICADLRLIVTKWGVCYHVHRMVLAQASFFQSLFLGGFSETAASSRVDRKGKMKAPATLSTDVEWAGQDLELHFDDPNITRAAFELCLSRLYSSFPHLHFPTALLPTTRQPLTPSFPACPVIDYTTLETSVPPFAHLATPRLLLSLLATTSYLGQGPLLREVLAITLRTVGPVTVARYLGFAIGDGIGEEEWPGQDGLGIKALSGVAKVIRHDNLYSAGQFDEDEDLVEETLHAVKNSPRHSTDSDTKVSETSLPLRHGGVPIPSLKLPSRSNSVRSNATDPFSVASADIRLMSHYYGAVGNKIGEACGCWLARWGVDLLLAETESTAPGFRIWAHHGLPSRVVRAVLSSDYFFVKDEMERYRFARKVIDLRRAGWDEDMEDGGDLSLAAGTLSGMDGTDDGWEEWEEEEREIQKVFAEGVHYCHMTFDDLSVIAADIDPNTHLPYAPLAVLQAAHWTAADLRARITAHERATEPAPAEDDNELGLMSSTSVITSSLRTRRRPTPRSRVPSPANPSHIGLPSLSHGAKAAPHASAHTVYHPVPTDETHRIGASGLLTMTGQAVETGGIAMSSIGMSIHGIPDFGPDLVDVPLLPEVTTSKSKARPPPHSEKTFFGLLGAKMTAAEIEEKWISEGGAFALSGLGFGDAPAKPMVEDRWTRIEPFRFSVEFFDVDKLSEKERFYSTTHFYAGSYFNCYVQMIKRKEKGVQLGIYLHRQSPTEPFPVPSAPKGGVSTFSLEAVAGLPATHALSTPITSSTATRMSTSPVVPGSPPAMTLGVSGGATHRVAHSSTTSPSQAPYIDTRSVTKAFFSISCASALGTALIRFTSGPDCFATSQSWGWKSSALKSEEYLSAPLSMVSKAVGEGEDRGGGEVEGLEDGVLGWSGEVPTQVGAYGQSSLRATVVVGVV